MNLWDDSLMDRFIDLCAELVTVNEEDRIKIINAVRIELHEASPFRNEPVDCVLWVPADSVQANDYNPNSVAPPEMALLETSIWEDGYTMPVVCYYIPEEDIYEIVDGYHRYTTLKTSKRIFEREGGMLPVVVIEKDQSNRMASTIRHNRARGSHSIELMSNIVAELTKSGMSDAWIIKHIGMDKDELLRLKQITGIAALFAEREFSEAFSGSI